jgi:hypothetical protein
MVFFIHLLQNDLLYKFHKTRLFMYLIRYVINLKRINDDNFKYSVIRGDVHRHVFSLQALILTCDMNQKPYATVNVSHYWGPTFVPYQKINHPHTGHHLIAKCKLHLGLHGLHVKTTRIISICLVTAILWAFTFDTKLWIQLRIQATHSLHTGPLTAEGLYPAKCWRRKPGCDSLLNFWHFS